MNKKENELIKNIEKKCTTIMIGSLARFEKAFGHLWDNDDKESDEYYNIWQTVRNDILNFGNHQLRDAVEYSYKFFLTNSKDTTRTNYYEFRFDKNQGDNNENQNI